jgi:FtsH-binding integral membrane protein
MAMALPIYGLVHDNPVLGGIARGVLSIPPLVTLLLFLGASFAVHAVSMVKGLNLIAFYLFAAFFGVFTSGIGLFALSAGGVPVIMNAAALTILVFGGLTSYVFISGKDFSFMGGFLTVGLFMVIGAIVLALLGSALFGVETSGFHLAISCVSVILFAGFVLYDTSNVLHHYATDMVVPAALALLIDFIILFRNLLMLLASMKRD